MTQVQGLYIDQSMIQVQGLYIDQSMIQVEGLYIDQSMTQVQGLYIDQSMTQVQGCTFLAIHGPVKYAGQKSLCKYIHRNHTKSTSLHQHRVVIALDNKCVVSRHTFESTSLQ